VSDPLVHRLEWPAAPAQTVIVVGAGALGGEVTALLMTSGVPHVHIVDPDVVSASTVRRTVAARQSDLGRPKVDVHLELHRRGGNGERLTATQGEFEALPFDIVRAATLVIGCVDSVRSRLRVAQQCALAGVPYLDTGVSDWTASVALYAPGEGGPCMGCVVSEEEVQAEAVRQACSGSEFADPTLSLQTTAAIAAGIAVQEALKLRVSDPQRMHAGQHIAYSVAEAATSRSWSPAREDCAFPHEAARVTWVSFDGRDAASLLERIRVSLRWVVSPTSVTWSQAMMVCRACLSNEPAISLQFDWARSSLVVRARPCLHDELEPVFGIGDLPCWERSARQAIEGQRLAVFGAAATDEVVVSFRREVE
jgi:molybdopterin/thiamine biosynthesis adenylyltransferase